MRKTLDQLLLVDNYRVIIGRLRLFFYVRLLRKLRTIDSEDAFEVTVAHNLKGLKIFRTKRILRLLNPLSIIETLDKDSKILVIGPRNENDLFLLWGLGFKRENVIGLDLITYSPYIQLGDMHNMDFDTDSFDAVVVGWTLSYSRSPQKLADELIRVTKNNGVIAIGVVYSEVSSEDWVKMQGYSITEEGYERINSTGEILKLFGNSVKDVYLNHDAPQKKYNKTVKGDVVGGASSVLVCFSISK